MPLGCFDLTSKAGLLDPDDDDFDARWPECCVHCHGLNMNFGESLIVVKFRGEIYEICCKVNNRLEDKLHLRKEKPL